MRRQREPVARIRTRSLWRSAARSGGSSRSPRSRGSRRWCTGRWRRRGARAPVPVHTIVEVEAMLRIAVIVGSTRERRFGEVVARWFVRRAEQRDDLELDVIDLRDIPLRPVQQTPFECDDPAVHALAARIEAADGFVVVTPEYNHGYPASLKLAIDSVYDGWLAKPVAFVSYGGVGGGLRAVEQLRQVFAELHAVTLRDTVSFHMAHDLFGEDGELRDGAAADAAARRLLDRLVWWASALRDARGRQPYVV